MPRGTVLSVDERRLITEKRALGWTLQAIANEPKRSTTVIHAYLKGPQAYATRKSPGRPRKLTDRDVRHIRKTAKQHAMTAPRVKAAVNASVSTRTVQCVLKATPHLRYRKRKKTPHLKAGHRTARVKRARDRIREQTDWASVIFSDEKKCNLDGPDGFQHYWHGLREEKEVFFSRQNGGGSLMVGGGFSVKGKTRLGTLTGRQNSFDYQQTLTTHLLPFGDDVHDGRYVFQHDNARIHASRSTKEFLSDLNVTVLDWPAVSPDLNPIENLWGIISRAVYDGGKQYHSVEELKEAVLKAWDEIPQETIDKLVKSMPDRCIDVLERRGGKTKY